MNVSANNSSSEIDHVIDAKRVERWEIYRRLQELEISCQCSPHQPLTVTLDRPTAVVQLWSVVKQLTTKRSELIAWIEQCWRLEI